MTLDEIVVAYAALPTDRQIRLLAEYASRLTVIARGTYVPGTEDIADPRRLRMLNEVQHRVTGHLCKLLAHDAGRYPDDVIVRTMIDGDDAELLAAVEEAMKQTDD
jgi:hypothetical protein